MAQYFINGYQVSEQAYNNAKSRNDGYAVVLIVALFVIYLVYVIFVVLAGIIAAAATVFSILCCLKNYISSLIYVIGRHRQ